MSLLEKLKKAQPKTNVVCTAVETLTDPAEMNQFYNEYVSYLRQDGDSDDARQNPESVATNNIVYNAVRYDRETAERWMKIIPSSDRPTFFGLDILAVTPRQAFNTGQVAAQEGTERSREYI